MSIVSTLLIALVREAFAEALWFLDQHFAKASCEGYFLCWPSVPKMTLIAHHSMSCASSQDIPEYVADARPVTDRYKAAWLAE